LINITKDVYLLKGFKNELNQQINFNNETKKVKDESSLRNCHHLTSSFNCEVINVVIVCSGFQTTHSLITLIKSILFYRKNPLHFYFFSDSPIFNQSVSTLFQTWMIPSVDVTFFNANDLYHHVKWIPNKHYSGIFGLLKLVISRYLPGKLSPENSKFKLKVTLIDCFVS